MQVKLHANATTTPKVRALIQQSQAPVSQLARQLGVSETTIRRWRQRSEVEDRSHCRHHLGQSTNATEEALIGELRRDVGLSLDDITEVMQRCVNKKLSRSAIYRCLRRHGISKPSQPPPDKSHAPFEPTSFGFVHVDLKHLPRLKRQPSYVFVAIERITRFVHVEIIPQRNATTVAQCLENFLQAFAHPVHTILTDNGSEFTDRFAVFKKNKPHDRPSGNHPFDLVCQKHQIEHRLTKPFRPQTNGMVERFNRRLAEALRAHPKAGTNGGRNIFLNPQQRNEFILQFVDAYNHTRLKCLNYKAPIESLHNLTEGYTFTAPPEAVFCSWVQRKV